MSWVSMRVESLQRLGVSFPIKPPLSHHICDGVGEYLLLYCLSFIDASRPVEEPSQEPVIALETSKEFGRDCPIPITLYEPELLIAQLDHKGKSSGFTLPQMLRETQVILKHLKSLLSRMVRDSCVHAVQNIGSHNAWAFSYRSQPSDFPYK